MCCTVHFGNTYTHIGLQGKKYNISQTGCQNQEHQGTASKRTDLNRFLFITGTTVSCRRNTFMHGKHHSCVLLPLHVFYMSDFMINFVSFPALMEWFRKGAAHTFICQWNVLTRCFVFMGFTVVVCNILQEHKNKYYMDLFASSRFTGLWSSFDIHIDSQYLKSNRDDCNIYSSTDMLNFWTKQAHLVYL